MKIVVVSSCVFRVPLLNYGGLEAIAWHCAKGLAEKGHKVQLVAPDGSTCPGVEVIQCGPAGMIDEKRAYGGFPAFKEKRMIDGKEQEVEVRPAHSGYWQNLLEADIVIDHSWQKWSMMLKREGRLLVPVLNVCHAPVNTMLGELPEGIEKPCFVCISEDQRKHFEALFNHPARTAYNGCFAGNTLLSLENGITEEIQSFVSRKGRDRVLSWNENRHLWEYVSALDWMELPAINDYAVEIKVEGSDLMLISTPDNPILTSSGWKPACDILDGDRVLYEEEAKRTCSLDTERLGYSKKKLWEEKSHGYSQIAGQKSIYSLLHSTQTSEIKTGLPQVQSEMDKRRNRSSKKELSKFELFEIKDKNTQTYIEWNKMSGSEDGFEEKQGNSIHGKSPIQTIKNNARKCIGLFGWISGWRRSYIISSQQKTKEHTAESRNRKQRFSDSSIFKNVVANSKLQRAIQGGMESYSFSKKSSQYVEIEFEWGNSREVFGSDTSIFNSKIWESFVSNRVLSDTKEENLEGSVHQKTNSDSTGIKNAKFQTWKKVVSVKRISTPKRVYDLKTPTGNFVANGIVVHNCDVNYYTPLDIPRNKRFLFLARFSTIKGPDLAIEACQKAGVGLDLIGDLSITSEPDYYQKCSSMSDGEKIKIIGPCSRGESVFWFSRSHMFLHTAKRFREPFGLAPVEALLCGCPVWSFDNGAMRETLPPSNLGLPGGLVESEEDLVKKINEWKDKDIDKGIRNGLRNWARRFSVEAMVDRYEELCREAIRTGGW